MTKGELLELWEALANPDGLEPSVKLGYAIERTRDRIRGEIQAIMATRKPPRAFEQYERERLKLVLKFAKKDEHGNPMVENQSYIFEPGTRLEYEVALDALIKEHKEAVELYQNQLEEWELLLKEPAESKLFLVPYSEVEKLALASEGRIKQAHMRAVYRMIDPKTAPELAEG
jgi:hypothetical protein